MITKIIDGKKIRDEILEKVKKEILQLPFQPVFCDILVGEDPVSKQYVEMKSKYAEKVGIKFHSAIFPSNITTLKLIEEIKKINKLENMCGIIIQLPLPETINKRAVLDSVDLNIDVDCLSSLASENFYKNNNEIGFPTALACLKILDSIQFDFINKNIVVVGQGDLVGMPLSALLSFRGLEIKKIVSDTKNKEMILRNADVIISAVGQGKIITGDIIKEGAIVIDAGTSESNGSVVGDVDLDSVMDIASFVSPVPGGVGPVTVAMLLSNVLQVAKNKNVK